MLLGQRVIWFQLDCEARCNIIRATLLHGAMRPEKYDHVLVVLSPQLRAGLCLTLPEELFSGSRNCEILGALSLGVDYKIATVQSLISFSRMFLFTHGSRYLGLPPPHAGDPNCVLEPERLISKWRTIPQNSAYFTLQEEDAIIFQMCICKQMQHATSLWKREGYFFFHLSNPRKRGCQVDGKAGLT